jgi:hypothetical protein
MLAVASVGAAIGQTGILAGLVQPFVVNIEQQVPVEVTLALPMDDGTVITATAPITVGVSLQVKIDGAQVVAVTSAEAEPAAATIEAVPVAEESAGEGVDAEGRTYTLEPDEGIEIAGVNSSANPLGGIEVVGEITNVTEDNMGRVEINGTFYDIDGNVVIVETTYAALETLQPGQSSPFKIFSMGDAAKVASYKLQAQP